MLIPLLIGAGIGAAKSELIDRPKEARQRKLKAEEIRMSPWTGMRNFTQVEEADPFGEALQGGALGASMFGGTGKVAPAQEQQYMPGMQGTIFANTAEENNFMGAPAWSAMRKRGL